MNIDASQPIAVLGAGSFGTALALALASNQRQVTLWGHNPDHLSQIKQQRENRRYLPGIYFPGNLTASISLAEVADKHQHFLIVVPSHAFTSTLNQLHSLLEKINQTAEIISWGTKGFEPDSGRLLSDVAAQIFGDQTQLAMITGPSFAKELAQGLPTTLTVASKHEPTCQQVAQWFKSPSLKAYTNDDLVGAQVGGAVKNVMAIATGICDGLGLGANARAGLITRGLAELTRLGLALGGKTQTFMGLSGLGDLILSCTDDQSRNRRVGLGLGQGKSLKQVLSDIGQEAEGVITTKTVYALSKKLNIDMPITRAVYLVLNDKLSPNDAVQELLQRQLTSEF